MGHATEYIAVDLGAESGRVMLGLLDGGKLTLREVHRFSHGPMEEGGTLRWGFAEMFGEIKAGIAAAVKESDAPIGGIAVDSWGVDYGLLDADGEMLGNPYHYRDSRTEGMLEKAFELMPKRDIYDNTGIQFMSLNTAYQLLSQRLADPEVLGRAKKLLFIADLVAYQLCGEMFAEYSLASTSQLLDMSSGKWSVGVFEKLGLPVGLMADVVRPGTVVGKLRDELASEFGCDPIAVIAAGSHDTASAVAAVPAEGDDWAYLSSGTWSLMGVEVPRAIIDDRSFENQFTNEGGVGNMIRLLKNIMGLWPVQECRRHWQKEGAELSYGELATQAEKAKPFVAYIDPDYDDFGKPGDMPGRISRYLAETGQEQIVDKGQLVRAILEGLALKYRDVMGRIECMIGKSIVALHIVGGGIQNELLCQFAADATGKKVVAGPVEATATGNVLMQAMAKGQIKSLTELRGIVRDSYELKEYVPVDTASWAEQAKRVGGLQKK